MSALKLRKKHVRILAFVLIAIGLVVVLRVLPVGDWLKRITNFADSLGPIGLIVFVGVYIVTSLVFVPGSVLTFGAGAAFGLSLGFVAVSVSSTTTATVAFLLSRTALRDRVVAWAEDSEKFAAIDAAVSKGGWKIVGLMRLSPVVPFSLSNYLFGLTSVRFWPYLLASWLAMMPGTLLYVYLGALGREGAAAATGNGEKTPAEWAMLGAGLVITLVVTIYVTRLAQKELRDQKTPIEHS